ncbi:MAG: DUF4417 domain-containing protein [Oscillospiraceae bacterium]|nr:DUF4417 domain-containing protein [Oscillospiraceae bacterium]
MKEHDFTVDFTTPFSVKDFSFGFEKEKENIETIKVRRLRAEKRLKTRGKALDNLFVFNPGGDNMWDIPSTEPFTDDLSDVKWIDFNNKQKITNHENTATHFYIQDYQFSSVWNKSEKYLPLLQKLKAVVTPDFSNYTDMPKAQDLWNCYRRQWCGHYWQQHGVNVISSLSWGVGKIYEWTFAGIPKGTTCATSFVCDRMDKETAIDELLLVLDRLQPHTLFVKCNNKDEEYLRKYIDFIIIPPYNWRRGYAKRE